MCTESAHLEGQQANSTAPHTRDKACRLRDVSTEASYCLLRILYTTAPHSRDTCPLLLPPRKSVSTRPVLLLELVTTESHWNQPIRSLFSLAYLTASPLDKRVRQWRFEISFSASHLPPSPLPHVEYQARDDTSAEGPEQTLREPKRNKQLSDCICTRRWRTAAEKNEKSPPSQAWL